MEETDASKAVDLMSFALYHETVEDNDDIMHAGSVKEKSCQDDDGDSIGGRYVSAASVTSFCLVIHLMSQGHVMIIRAGIFVTGLETSPKQQ